MRMQPLSPHLRKLCRQLGPDYETTIIDLEYVIRRDFGNGYDLEISGVNTSSLKRKATLYVWKDKKHIVEKIYNVARDNIGSIADELYQKYSSL